MKRKPENTSFVKVIVYFLQQQESNSIWNYIPTNNVESLKSYFKVYLKDS